MTAFESLKVPGPIPTRISRPFWDAAEQGRFVLQRCDACSSWVFYPRSHCPHCWSTSLSWRQASGKGRVKSFTIVHRPGHTAWGMAAPYPIALIEFDEGPTMLSMLVDIPLETIHIGMIVAVRFVRIGEFTLPMFS